VGIGVDREVAALLDRLPNQSPRWVKAFGPTVDLDRNLELPAGLEDQRRIEL
jgi:hypothetical protein